MKYILLISLLLTGCYDYAKCIDGELYFNNHPYAMDNIYTKSKLGTECVVKD